jgi:hypothetical protein
MLIKKIATIAVIILSVIGIGVLIPREKQEHHDKLNHRTYHHKQ